MSFQAQISVQLSLLIYVICKHTMCFSNKECIGLRSKSTNFLKKSFSALSTSNCYRYLSYFLLFWVNFFFLKKVHKDVLILPLPNITHYIFFDFAYLFSENNNFLKTKFSVWISANFCFFGRLFLAKVLSSFPLPIISHLSSFLTSVYFFSDRYTLSEIWSFSITFSPQVTLKLVTFLKIAGKGGIDKQFRVPNPDLWTYLNFSIQSNNK